jgi:hypothetical protein
MRRKPNPYIKTREKTWHQRETTKGQENRKHEYRMKTIRAT